MKKKSKKPKKKMKLFLISNLKNKGFPAWTQNIITCLVIVNLFHKFFKNLKMKTLIKILYFKNKKT